MQLLAVIANLLKPAGGKLTTPASVSQPAAVVSPESLQPLAHPTSPTPPVEARAKLLLEHDALFQQPLRTTAAADSGQCGAVTPSVSKTSILSAASTTGPCALSSCPDARSRSTQCMLLMHTALKEQSASAPAATLQSERGMLLEDLILSLPAEVLQLHVTRGSDLESSAAHCTARCDVNDELADASVSSAPDLSTMSLLYVARRHPHRFHASLCSLGLFLGSLAIVFCID